ncbi:MAG: molybdate ABC transporter substrate-binding protein [Pseudomonadota bacterium]
MTCRGRIRWLLAAVLALGVPFAPIVVSAEEPVRVAVASNFVAALRDVVHAFNQVNSSPISLSAASTGKLFAQIKNGAPFDVFFAADSARPAALEAQGYAVAGSRFTYAGGALTLWSADRELDGQACEAALVEDQRGKIAIANPRTAPYGSAAEQVLRQLGVLESAQKRIVVGENVQQALQFAASGNARFALVSTAQLRGELLTTTGCRWPVPADLHDPVAQQAVLLKRGTRNSSAAALLAFVRSDAGRAIIAGHGYLLADQN